MRRLLLVLVVAAGLGVLWADQTLVRPADARLDAMSDWRPPTESVVLDAEGTVVDRFGPRRVFVPLSEIPEGVWQVILAAEDQRFFDHVGVDIIGIARALRANISAGEITEGGSTITQQLIKNLLVGDAPTFARKFDEAVLAWRLERRVSKAEILETYLNYVYLGEGNYGLEAAAQDYFGVSARSLQVDQAALLAALIPAPSRAAPRANPGVAIERRNRVLDAMIAQGRISEREGSALKGRGLTLREPTPVPPPEIGAAYLTAVRHQLREEHGELPDSLRIQTAFDPAIQAIAIAGVQAAVDGVTARQRGRVSPQGAAAVIDNHTGHVVALVGGLEESLEGFSRATQARRQPGSSFKPYVYAAALMAGQTQLDTVLDAPLEIDDKGGGIWSPQNYGGRFSGADLPLRVALTRSVNTAAVRLAMKVGPDRVAVLARQMGITTPLRRSLPMALGASEVTPLDQAVAYSTIARGGLARPAVLITDITDDRGQPTGFALPPEQAVLTPEVAGQLLDMLRAVVTSGTGRDAWRADRDRAGKTGTTNDFEDAWFVGMTPDHTIAVWVGTDDSRSLGEDETGGHAALPAFIHIADATQQTARFPVPDAMIALPWRGQQIWLPRSATATARYLTALEEERIAARQAARLAALQPAPSEEAPAEEPPSAPAEEPGE